MKALLAALLLALAACGGAVSSSSPSDDPDAAASTETWRPGDAGTSRDATLSARDANEPVAVFPGPATEPTCADDTECNEPGGGAFGKCWKSATGTTSCLCKKGGFKQPSGRCGPTPPAATCAGQGGRCMRWPACTDVGGNLASARTPSSCTGEDVCCVTECKATAIEGCYVHGSDAAYVPVCVGGWVTCQSGDSPDLELP